METKLFFEHVVRMEQGIPLLIERRIEETIIGFDCKRIDTQINAMELSGAGELLNAQAFLARLSPSSGATSYTAVIYKMTSIPIDAHFNVVVNLKEEPLMFHVTKDTTKPRAKYEASHPDYTFFLILFNSRECTSYLVIRNNLTKEITAMGMPNTWIDGRACLGSKLTDMLSVGTPLTSYAKLYETFLTGRYNDHLINEDTITMKYFWKFNSAGKWMPDASTAPQNLPKTASWLTTPLILL